MQLFHRGPLFRCLLVLAIGIMARGADLTVEDVLALLKAQVPEQVILTRIKTGGKAFTLSTDQILELKKAGAGENVLLLMMDPTAAPTTVPPTGGVATPPPAAPIAPDFEFTDVGVYYKKAGKWMEILPEIVNWKTGGVLKSIASAGIVKKDVNGMLPGPHSRNSINSALEFIILMPEGVAITEYQLIRLRPNKDYREFRTMTGGVFNQKSGAMRDMVPFEGKRLSGRAYSVILPNTLGAADYGFIYLGASGGAGSTQSLSMGKMYTFRLTE